MKQLHLLAALALLAGCSVPASHTVPVAGAPGLVAPASQLVDVPVAVDLVPAKGFSLLQLDPGVVSSVSISAQALASNPGSLIRAIGVEVYEVDENGNEIVNYGGLEQVAAASNTMYPEAKRGIHRWEVFTFPNGINAGPAPLEPGVQPRFVIRGLGLGKLYKARLRAFGPGEAPVLTADAASGTIAATSTVQISSDKESESLLDLRSVSANDLKVPVFARLKLAFFPIDASFGPYYKLDPQTGLLDQGPGNVGMNVLGGSWVAANGLATTTPAVEVASVTVEATSTERSARPADVYAAASACLSDPDYQTWLTTKFTPNANMNLPVTVYDATVSDTCPPSGDEAAYAARTGFKNRPAIAGKGEYYDTGETIVVSANNAATRSVELWIKLY